MIRPSRLRRVLGTVLAIALIASVPVSSAVAKKPKAPVDIQILGLNDYHGQLEVVPPLASSGGRIGFLTDLNPDPNLTNNACLPATCVAAGGTEYLATHVANLKEIGRAHV